MTQVLMPVEAGMYQPYPIETSSLTSSSYLPGRSYGNYGSAEVPLPESSAYYGYPQTSNTHQDGSYLMNKYREPSYEPDKCESPRAWAWGLIIFLFLILIIWLILIASRPRFVQQVDPAGNCTGEIDNCKAILWSIAIAIVAIILVWIIRTAAYSYGAFC